MLLYSLDSKTSTMFFMHAWPHEGAVYAHAGHKLIQRELKP